MCDEDKLIRFTHAPSVIIRRHNSSGCKWRSGSSKKIMQYEGLRSMKSKAMLRTSRSPLLNVEISYSAHSCMYSRRCLRTSTPLKVFGPNSLKNASRKGVNGSEKFKFMLLRPSFRSWIALFAIAVFWFSIFLKRACWVSCQRLVRPVNAKSQGTDSSHGSGRSNSNVMG